MLDSVLSFIGKGLDMWNSSEQTDKKIAADKALQEQNIAHQKEFAQSGIRWKVDDAKMAGLHPLAALGAQTNSFSNIVAGDIPISKSSFGDMGQDLGRAIDAGSTQGERSDRMGQAIARTAQVFSLEKMNLENELLKSHIAKTNATLPPALPGSALAHLSRSPARTTEGHPIDDKKIEQQPSDAPAYKTYKFMGIPLQANPNFSDGQVTEDRLGDSEVLSTMTAVANLLADIQRTYGKSTFLGRGNKPPRTFPYWGQ